ncbi:hypothetical protein [Dactylosporangium sp. NPDC050588]|uniref:hypothetical protein n=1 Tax=Dactylosporangium sp. NPDC050588 TaxID=3157211 RepID=UPI0033D08512
MKRLALSTLLVTLIGLTAAGCKADEADSPAAPATTAGAAATQGGDQYPKGDDGAKALLQALPKDPALVQKLQPTAEDYKALFVGAAAAKAEQFYKKNVWTGQKVEVTGSAAQTELKVSKASSDDLKAWTAAAEAEFPGGYKDVGPHLQPGVTWYRWRYTEPGKDSGMAFDGLVHVNGHWVWTPKPWKALEG